MAKARKAPKNQGIPRKGRRGTEDITIPDFQLAPDAVPGIAQVIVNIWTGDQILNKDNGP